MLGSLICKTWVICHTSHVTAVFNSHWLSLLKQSLCQVIIFIVQWIERQESRVSVLYRKSLRILPTSTKVFCAHMSRELHTNILICNIRIIPGFFLNPTRLECSCLALVNLYHPCIICMEATIVRKTIKWNLYFDSSSSQDIHHSQMFYANADFVYRNICIGVLLTQCITLWWLAQAQSRVL